MIPWSLLDTATVPGSSGQLRLLKRGAEFAIMLGRAELMNSRRTGSEQALAALAAERVKGRAQARMLIGGLGMGFTLGAALEALPAGAHIDVAELVPAVVAWAGGPLASLFGESLTDPRVAIHTMDVAELIRAAPQRYDAILLDVDNGPDGLTRPANDALYNGRGLALAHTALRPGGILAVWSAAANDAFTMRLRTAGFDVEEVRVRAHGKRGTRHTIWIAVRREIARGGAVAMQRPDPAKGRGAVPAHRRR